MLLQELFALAVSEAEEEHIHLVEMHFICEAEVCLTNESLVHLADRIAGVALAIGKDYLSLRMSEQHPYQFAASISRSTKDTNINALHPGVPNNMHGVPLMLP